MHLTLCIASRGNPEQLSHVIREMDSRLKDPDQVTISVALDSDDPSLQQPPEIRAKLIWSVEPREDSLGAKYNRCQRNAPADGYLLGADDNLFSTANWDQIIRDSFALFPDKLGLVYFGRLDGALPTQMAIPHILVERQGFMFPEHFPVWFHDTWMDEIGHLCGRIIWCGIEVEEIGGRGRTRGLRDVIFWATLFEALRPQRQAFGEALSREFNEPWLQVQLQQRRQFLHGFFRTRTERLRNPATAVHFQQRYSHDAPADERYRRIKAKAEQLLAELQQPAQEAAA